MLLENEVINYLAKEQIELLSGAQVDETLNLKSMLSIKLHQVITNTTIASERKSTLAQILLGLNHLELLECFNDLQEQDINFLNFLLDILQVPGSKETLQPLLSGYTPGLAVLKAIAQSSTNTALFKVYIKNKPAVNDALVWLCNQKGLSAKLLTTAIEVAFKKPDISPAVYKSIVDCLRTTPNFDSYDLDITGFLIKYHDQEVVVAEVSALFKKMAGFGIKSSKIYRLALESPEFRSLVRQSTVEPDCDKELILVAAFLININQSQFYEYFVQNRQLAAAFNKFIQYEPLISTFSTIKSEEFISKLTQILENKRLEALVNAGICPSVFQINQLLDSESTKSQAMDLLLSLCISEENAYKWAFIDTPTADQFRRLSVEITKASPYCEQAKMIKTLVQLQTELKGVFGLYLDPSEKGTKFREAIAAIEATCTHINQRLKESAIHPKTGQFAMQEDDYRKVMYQLVFTTLNPKEPEKPITKKELSKAIEQASKPMLDVVDIDRRPWVRTALAILANLLNIILFTAPSHIITGRALFFAHTKSGYKLRDLNEDLIKKLS